MVAPPFPTSEGSKDAFAYAAESQAARSSTKRSLRSKYYKENASVVKRVDDPIPPSWMVEDEMLAASNNIMYDRRVVRGNTYAAQVVTQSAQRETARLRQEHERRMRLEALRRRQAAKISSIPRTPPPVEGRLHMDMQTDDILEELTDRPLELSTETQTDAIMDRPASPLFVPAKSGVDVDTQVVVGDLFDFDLEVEPILEVLVGKTLELSVLEVMEEEELSIIRSHHAAFVRKRNAEMAEVQRMEAEARRKQAEKMRRMKQQKEFMKARGILLEKVAARSFAKNYLFSLRGDVYDDLEKDGFFYDPLTKEIEDVFLPWLLDDVAGKVDRRVKSMSIVDGFLSETTVLAIKIHKEAMEAKEAEIARIRAEAAAEEAWRKVEMEARAQAEQEALEREEEGAGKEGADEEDAEEE